MSDYKAKYTGPPLIVAYFCVDRVREGDEEVDTIALTLPVTDITQPTTDCFLIARFNAVGFTGTHRFTLIRFDNRTDATPVVDAMMEFLPGQEEFEATTSIKVPTSVPKRMLYWIAVDGQILERLAMDVVEPQPAESSDSETETFQA